MTQVTINSAKSIIEKMISYQNESGKHMPVFIHSSPGVGKSAIVRQIADQQNMGFVDVRMAQFEASDISGVPFVKDDENGAQVMDISTPKWFPSKEAIAAGDFPEKGILFFDELSNAPIAVQHAGYRIILDREVSGGVKLGDGWIIIAAGNLKEDKTGAKPVAPALANRFASHIFVKPDLEAFMAYAVNAGIHESVIGFLNFAGHHLYTFDPARQDMAFASPRSWEYCSDLMKIGYPEEMLQTVIGGCVGDGVAAEFMAFLKYYDQLPDLEKIANGEVEYKIPNDRGVVFALCSSLIMKLSDVSDNENKIKNLGKLMNQLDDEFVILVYKMLKNITDSKGIAKIMINTREVFRRVYEYVSA